MIGKPKHIWLILLLLSIFLTTCNGVQSDGPTFPTPVPTPARDEQIEPQDGQFPQGTANGLTNDRTDLVAGSGNCVPCHTRLGFSRGDDISYDSTWRASMMAHSARDPFFQAMVSTETDDFPEQEEMIADLCSSCHMPLAHFDAVANGETPLILGEGFLNPDNPRHELAMDGVSCTLCHQIQPDNLGEQESFSGHYLIDQENRGFGERLSFGPLPITEINAEIMAAASGYTAVESAHTAEGDLCGTCHNLYTPTLDSRGEIIGEFPMQTTHLEWANSSFAGRSCSSCHMPEIEEVKIANVAEDPQPALRQHTFTGANAYMLLMLQTNAAETGITAEYEHMKAAFDRTITQLEDGRDIRVGTVTLEDGILTAEVIVINPNGHKRPSGFPARRMWIHMWVEDADGEVVFESGAYDNKGMITGNDNDLDPTRYEPHYLQIDSPDEVQIYETILYDSEMEITTSMLRAAGYLKDNRLYPRGFPVNHPPEDIAAYGAAAEDQDFIAGQDAVRYVIDVGQAEGPFTIRFELLYQTIGYRWAENLRQYDTDLAATFMGYYDESYRLPMLIGTVEATRD